MAIAPLSGEDDQIFKSLNRIAPVSRETFHRLSIYIDLLRTWQSKTNLISQDTLDAIWERHVADSLQLFPLAVHLNSNESLNWIDIGSGGGFPGLVIAAMMQEMNTGRIALVESNQKKAAFLRQANRKMGTDAAIHAERIESAAKRFGTVNIVSARAFAPLSTLLELAAPMLMTGAVGLFHKGREYRREIEECNGLWAFDLVDHPSRIASDSVILEVRNLKAGGFDRAQ